MLCEDDCCVCRVVETAAHSVWLRSQSAVSECTDLTAALLTTRSPAQPSSIFQIKLQQQRQINVSIKTIIVKRKIVHYRLQYRQATSQPIAWPYTRLGTLAAVTMVM